ncbi:hypothetical protein ATO12_15855 [Aquimarina atlantica]|uniref:NAD glycohydrolase translocation F5/8 type C domain-containing protein n=1 Tax=Aquimarina atlantica TaxID=1317122 RepID=A0A023BUC1_9FLAO|nr:hypothetical protein [Aquimarina atlantica]EZH73413.1 hypothetical protein ATO12_15855 [Aquimarina atlantica]
MKIKLVILLLVCIACNSNKKKDINIPVIDAIKIDTSTTIITSKLDEKQKITIATIDSVSINEIEQFTDKELSTIYEYYQHEKIDEVAIWSEKLFGRCCTEADLDYSELLFFDITTNSMNKKYPFENLSDKTYRTTFVFEENENTAISIRLNRNNKWHKTQTNLLVDDVLKTNDTILYPFRLSIVNGYVKSDKTFKENGRVKKIKVFLNNNYQDTVQLQDTPLVQEFNLDFIYSKNDVVTLMPISYYKGTKYSDICISEIQSSLSRITHPSINRKYKVRELWEIGNKSKNSK